MKKSLLRFSGLAVIAGAIAVLSNSVFAGPPVCPQIYAPVICSNGKIYPNQCYADRHHATGCVPYGGL